MDNAAYHSQNRKIESGANLAYHTVNATIPTATNEAYIATSVPTSPNTVHSAFYITVTILHPVVVDMSGKNTDYVRIAN